METQITVRYDETKQLEDIVRRINTETQDLNIIETERVKKDGLQYDIITIRFVNPENLFLLGMRFVWAMKDIYYPDRNYSDLIKL